MNRRSFEHVIKAAAAVVQDELVVVGSQAVLAHDPDPRVASHIDGARPLSAQRA